MTRFLTKPILYTAGAAVVVLGLGFGVQTVRLANERADHHQTRAAHAKTLQNIANLTAIAATDARATERGWAEQFAAAAAGYHEDLTNAQATADRVTSDLRDGNLWLRKEWRGCQAAARVPGAPAGSGPSDASADLRGAGAGDLVRIGAQCDATIRALQAVATQ